MAVKTIFKVLIGTIVTIVIASLIIEIININTTGMQINQLSKLGVKQACVFFGQETYKREDAQSVNMEPVVDNSGITIVGGNFYDGNTPNEIYESLYSGTKFSYWANEHENIWSNLDALLSWVQAPEDEPQTEKESLGKMYYENRMTPLNLGIPYLDIDAVEKIARWNLAAIFSNGNSNMVVIDSEEGTYIKYKGFRVFVTEATITNIEYKVINAITERDEFIKYTNINPDSLGLDGASDERANVCLAGISYRVPIAYEGVTPFRRVMEFGWNYRVRGVNNVNNNNNNTEYNMASTDLSAGGLDGDTALPVPGEVIFYIIK